MHSFIDLSRTLAGQPPQLGVQLSRIDVGRGREQLFAEQMPQVLTRLAETTRVASIQASTAIEGYDVSDQRAERIALNPNARFRNRNEKEFAGYRDAIDEMVRDHSRSPVSAAFTFYLATRLHRHTTGEPGGPKKDQNYIVSYEGGERRLIFTPVEPRYVESKLRSLVAGYNETLEDEAAHPVLLLGLFVLDLLAIHPVADGNGRISRLLTVHELLRIGYGVPRYASIEQRIFATKNSYYDALEASQQDWHEAVHDAWPWLTYFVGVIADAYEQFESRLTTVRSRAGTKAQQARHYVLHEGPKSFRFTEAVAALPGISPATIRQAMNDLRDEGKFSVNRGRAAVWRRL